MNRRKTTLMAGIILGVVAAFALIAQGAIITNGLVGRWIFDETSGITGYDSSGYGDNATLSGAALFTTDSDQGQVLAITGISGLVEIPYHQVLAPYSGTISVWVKPTLAATGDIVTHQTNALLRCPRQFGGYAYALRVYKNGSPAAIFANDNPKSCTKSPQIVVSGPAKAAPLNEWTHLVTRWDGVKTLSLFANGKQVAKSSYSPNPTYGLSYSGQAPVNVGNLPRTGVDLEFAGSVSDLRIYSRPLSNTEITNIYRDGQ